MRRFQGLHVVSKDHTPERPSTGLEPYLALKPRPHSKPRAKRSVSSDPDRFWQLMAIAIGAIVLIAMGFL